MVPGRAFSAGPRNSEIFQLWTEVQTRQKTFKYSTVTRTQTNWKTGPNWNQSCSSSSTALGLLETPQRTNANRGPQPPFKAFPDPRCLGRGASRDLPALAPSVPALDVSLGTPGSGRGRAEGQRRAGERHGRVLLNSGPPRGPHPSSRGLRLERKWEGSNLFLTPAPSCPRPSAQRGPSARRPPGPRPASGAPGAGGLAETGRGERPTSGPQQGREAARPPASQARGRPRRLRRPDVRERHFRAVQRRPLGRWLRPVARSCPPTRR